MYQFLISLVLIGCSFTGGVCEGTQGERDQNETAAAIPVFGNIRLAYSAAKGLSYSSQAFDGQPFQPPIYHLLKCEWVFDQLTDTDDLEQEIVQIESEFEGLDKEVKMAWDRIEAGDEQFDSSTFETAWFQLGTRYSNRLEKALTEGDREILKAVQVRNYFRSGLLIDVVMRHRAGDSIHAAPDAWSDLIDLPSRLEPILRSIQVEKHRSVNRILDVLDAEQRDLLKQETAGIDLYSTIVDLALLTWQLENDEVLELPDDFRQSTCPCRDSILAAPLSRSADGTFQVGIGAEVPASSQLELLLNSPRLQQEISLSAQQIEELQIVHWDFQNQCESLQQRPDIQNAPDLQVWDILLPEIDRMNQEVREQMNKILLPHQTEFFPRLVRQHMLVVRGIRFVLLAHPLTENLHLTDGQREKIEEVCKSECARLKELSLGWETEVIAEFLRTVNVADDNLESAMKLLCPTGKECSGSPEGILRMVPGYSDFKIGLMAEDLELSDSPERIR